MKNKKWLLLLIVAFPSAFWIILELSTINSKKLPHHGPKTFNGKDSIFYTVQPAFKHLKDTTLVSETIDTENYPVFGLMFVSKQHRKEGYRLDGLMEYLKYKKSNIEHLPFIFVAEYGIDVPVTDDLSFLKPYNNTHVYQWETQSFDSLNNVFFKEKPYYIDYSFLMLIDKERHIRGYYDMRYVAEVKRFIDECKHLVIKEEKNKTTQQNEIKTTAH
ncbi:MAG: hypothetical protein QM534_01465 [Sediminibacterium sp.]|nr:hypothetical protein [Sediminibacterium sp.]